MIQQLSDAGLSDSEIGAYFQQAQGLGKQSLSDYFNQAGTAIGQQFEPAFAGARDTLGANPLLADSGYANRLNRQIMTDLGARLSGDYGARAADESSKNLDFYRSLVGQRTGLRSDLARGAYQTFTGLPHKKKIGEQLLEAGAGVAGSVAGAVAGRPPGLPQAASAAQPVAQTTGYYPNYRRNTYTPSAASY